MIKSRFTIILRGRRNSTRIHSTNVPPQAESPLERTTSFPFRSLNFSVVSDLVKMYASWSVAQGPHGRARKKLGRGGAGQFALTVLWVCLANSY